jgi:hypothetical protein
MLVLTMRRLAATGTGGSGSGSFPALRGDTTRIDEMGVECVKGTGIVGSEGKREAVLVTGLLTTAFLTGCIGLDVACNVGLGSTHISCLGLSIEGWEAVARVETAGVGILTAATGTGEHDFVLVHLSLTATFLTGCCIVFDTTFDGGFVSSFERRGRTVCAGGGFSNE